MGRNSWFGRLLALAILGAGPAQAAEVPVGELPDQARPIAYRVALTADPSSPRFAGTTEIDLDLKAAADSLWIHGQGLDMQEAVAVAGGAIVQASYQQLHATGVARLVFARPLPAGRVMLKFRYTAPFMPSAAGFYRAEVGGQWYAWTQFQAIDARRAFPGFDEPRHKTPFTVSLTVPAGMKAFANAPEVAAEPVAGGMVRHRFAPTEPLPTYLVALAVGDFDVVEASIPPNAVRTTPLSFRAIATRGQAPRLATTMAETPRILAILEDYFGSPYPFAKLDVIASPIMGGAMENAGLVTFDDTLLLLDRDAPLSQLRSFGVVMAHELAHMWFGDLVTPRWWDDIWLNESFAEWMGNRAALAWRPDLGIRSDQIAGALAAMAEDSLPVGRPIRQPITDSANVNAAFDGVTYAKGGQVIRMFEQYLGPDRFRDGVRLHLQRFRYGTADADAFFQSMADGSRQPELVAAWRSFVDQQGVPLVTFSAAPGGRFALAQARDAPIGGIAPGDARWQVPVCAQSGEGQACTLLTGATGLVGPVLGNRPWVAGNAAGAGYYRYDLPAADWDRLLAAGAELPAPAALTAADSLWARFAAGRGTAPALLAATQALAANPDRLAATWLAVPLGKAASEALLPGSRAPYARFVRQTWGTRLASLGLDPRRGAHAGDDPELRQLRIRLAQLMALDGRDPATRATLQAATLKMLDGDMQAIDPALRGTGLAVVAEEGGVPAADRLFALLVGSSDPLLRRQLAQALGFMPEAAAASHVLGRIADPRLQSLEATGILTVMLDRPETRATALSWVQGNWDVLRPRLGGLLGRFVGATGGFCSEADARAVEALFRPKLAELNLGSLDLDRPVAEIRQCAALKAARGAELVGALAAQP